ncbi:hypothetical protein PCANC_17647 [Puccinia coronata f. sp. avenae]|uniref:DEAD/DEAH box helicase domain-containing protein n=1 Tax=Puccinia coronata f. sp. avenae TaxID=200324 RepID=A0A2N5SFS4_9BASI|nr:hypothetical protein PCANC_17647 [Puccinia coronata f. sp. avenae]
MLPNPNRFLLSTNTPPLTQRSWSATGINPFKKVFNMKDQTLKEHIADVANQFYGQPAKSLRIDTVANLVMGCNTFLLAGTGIGKSRMAKIYYKLIPRKKRAVLLVLNPLDSLGNNQVFEKEQAGFTAINLYKLNFNKIAADDIAKA